LLTRVTSAQRHTIGEKKLSVKSLVHVLQKEKGKERSLQEEGCSVKERYKQKEKQRTQTLKTEK